MSDKGRGRRGGGMPPVVGDGERRRTRSTTATQTSSRSTAFPDLGAIPHHTLADSRKRGRSFGAGASKGDDRVTTDAQRAFVARDLSAPSSSAFNDLFSQADSQREKRRRTSFAQVETHTHPDGTIEHQAFGVIEPIGNVLTGRTVPTPKADDGRPGVDDDSHAIPLSGVSDQTTVNKRSFVFSESSTANRGGARVIERFALKQAESADFGDIAQVTRWTVPPGSRRPNHVSRSVLKRDKRRKSVRLLFASSHDNEDGNDL